MIRACEDIVVVEVATNVAGPYAAQILGDLGATVLKVEKPGVGDSTRYWFPQDQSGESTPFAALNRNKKSIELDLQSQQGRDRLWSLVDSADVVIQSLRPGVFEALGFTAEGIRTRNPSLIYCELSGFGPVGPLRDAPAYDPLIQAFTGLMSITGHDSSSPARIPVPILDQGTGLWAAIAILESLLQRNQNGGGSHIECSLLQTAFSWLAIHIAGYQVTGEVPQALGSGIANVAPYQAFAASDAGLVVAVATDSNWQKLCIVIDREDLITDLRFHTNTDRVTRRDELQEVLSAEFMRRTASEWLTALEAAGVPAGPINHLDEALEHPQSQAILNFAASRRIDDFPIDPLRFMPLPFLRDGEQRGLREMPPELGQNNSELPAT